MSQVQLWEMRLPLIKTEEGEALSELLEFEAVSTSWHENKDQPTLWDFLAHFDEIPDEADLKTRLSKVVDTSDLTVAEVPQLDWLAESYRNFPPLEIGGFYVYGSHIDTPCPGDRIPILVNAATAFGSGEHETTSGCLQAIERLASGRSFDKLLDMGCGSGILAMGMAKIFNHPVLAIDNDPEAVKMTAENAQANDLADLIHARLSEGFADTQIQGPFDLITANILAGPLCEMAQDMANHMEPDGYVILSGLLTTQKEMVETAYRMAQCKLVDCITIGDWCTLIMRKALDE